MILKTIFSLEFNMATNFASIKSNKKGISVKGIFFEFITHMVTDEDISKVRLSIVCVIQLNND